LGPTDNTDLGVDEIGVDEIGVDEIGVDEIGVDEIGVDEIGVDEIGVDEIGVDEIGAVSDIDESQSTLSGGNAPSGLSGGVFGSGNTKGILLTWTGPSGNVTAYTIYRSTTISMASDTLSSDPPTVIGPLAPNVQVPGQPIPSYLDLGVKNNTRYRYIVVATFTDPATGDTSGSGPSFPAFATFQ